MEPSWAETSKTVYVAPRHPRLDRDAFRARWRQHGALAMSLSIWEHACRYEQCDTIPGLDAALGLPVTADDHWGLGLVWLRDVDALRAMTADPTFPILYDDEPEAFGAQVEHFMLVAQEAVLWDDGGTEVKLTGLLARRPGGDPADLWPAIAGWAATEAASGSDHRPAKVVLNRRRAVAYVGLEAGDGGTVRPAEAAASTGLSSLDGYDGAVEIGFASREDAVRHLRRNGGRLVPPSVAAIDERSWLVLATNELLLYDER